MIQCPSCNHKSDDGAKFCPKCGAALVRAPGSNDDDVVGRIVAGKFRIEALIGEGGMGKVFRATQLSLDKTVVLKVLRTSLLGDARTVARFQREAKAASRLNHPNSISVIDFGQSDDGSLFIAMEYVAGEDLHQLLSREGPLAQKRIARIVGQVLSALADAHAAGVIHRDLKPENIMVEQRRGEADFVKVLDFGIAKIQESEGNESGQALTRAGFVCGTPEYMSPEQARGLQLDARSDLYAVGVICYQCATNMLPFESDSAVGLATMHLTTAPTPPREKRPDAPITKAMEALILRAMEKDPANRPQSAEDFRRDLMALENEEDSTHVQTLPRPVMRSTGPRRVHKGSSASASHPPPPSVATTPTWASSPGQGDDRTAVQTNPGPGRVKPKAKGAKSTALMFVGALVGTAVLAGGGLMAYDQLRQKGSDPEPVVESPVTPVKPPPGDINLADPSLKKDRARQAREMISDGDVALGASEYDRAVSRYLGAYEIDPAPGLSKRLALAYMLKNDPSSANTWLRQYVKDARGEADVGVIERYLRNQ